MNKVSYPTNGQQSYSTIIIDKNKLIYIYILTTCIVYSDIIHKVKCNNIMLYSKKHI